ncbi:MAG: BatA domain-containing protein [Bacteroidales bacterium]|nr:BatA domain-containing protein [Bacteroidales bacterium]
MNIQFQNPNVLYFLFLLAIPIIIHLFSFRKYQTIFFSNFKLLQNIIIENNKTKSKLKQLLILISRLLALTALILAFSRPYIPSEIQKTPSSTVAIYVDNSFSLTTENQYGILLEQAKKKATLLAKAFDINTEFYLITNDFSNTDEIAYTHKQISEKITGIKSSHKRKTISEIVGRVNNIIKNKTQNGKLYIISDLQKNIIDIEEKAIEPSLSITIIPLEKPAVKNIYIDSCWFEDPTRKTAQQDVLSIKIKNTGDETQKDLPIKLYINDTLKAISSLTIPGQSSETLKLPYVIKNKGAIYGRVEISDFPVIYDNNYFFSYQIPEKIKILLIGENKYIESVYLNDSSFIVNTVTNNQINYSNLNNYDVIYLTNTISVTTGLQMSLLSYLENGKTLVISFANKVDLTNVNELLSIFSTSITETNIKNTSTINNINTNHFITKNVFESINKNNLYPSVKKYYKIKNASTAEVILKLENEDSYLSYQNHKTGKLYIFSSELSDSATNLMQNPIFIPIIYNIALYSTSNLPIQFDIAEENFVQLSKNINSEIVTITNTDKSYSFIPQLRKDILNNNNYVYLHDNISQAGHWSIFENEEIIQPLSCNFSRAESKLQFLSISELEQIIDQKSISNISVSDSPDELIATTIQNEDQGIRLWKHLIIMCLFFILVEVALIRLL